MGYEAAAATARAILARKGLSVTITRKGQGTANEISGTRATGGDQTAVFNCVALPPGKSADYEVGSLIGRTVSEFHLARTAGSLDPQPGDILPWKGREFTLIWCAVYDPDASGMVYAKAYGEIGG